MNLVTMLNELRELGVWCWYRAHKGVYSLVTHSLVSNKELELMPSHSIEEFKLNMQTFLIIERELFNDALQKGDFPT